MGLKVGMVLDREFPSDPRVEREAITLIKNGFKIYLLCIDLQGRRTPLEICDGIIVKRVRMSRPFWKKTRPLVVNFPGYNLFWNWHIRRFVKEFGIEALHIHDLPLMGAGIKIGREYGVPVIGDFHENFCEALKMYDWATHWKGRLLIDFDKWDAFQCHAVHHIDKAIVTSDEAVDLFHSQYGMDTRDICVVDNSIDIEQFNRAGILDVLDRELVEKCKDRIVFGYVGAILPNRGLQHIICVLDRFRDRKIKLVIVGRGTYKRHLEEIAHRLEVSHLIDWYDWQPFENVLTFVKNFDIGLTRLERNLQNDYTTPNKVFQYMYLSKPVLTADSLPMRRIVEENNAGFVFESGNEAQLVDRISRLCADATLRKQMGENGRTAVLEKYNWAITSGGFVALYEEVEERYSHIRRS